MDESNKKVHEYVRRIMLARMSLLCNQGFFGMLLMHVKMALGTEYDTAYTNGKCIYFNPKFLDSINDKELEFVLNHEIMHIVLKHLERQEDRESDEYFNIAADIVVNSSIMHANGDDETTITLRNFGVSMHKTPEGDEGYLHNVEEVYDMLCMQAGNGNNPDKQQSDGSSGGGKENNPRKGQNPQGFDYHTSFSDNVEDSEYENRLWDNYIKNAAETVRQRQVLNGGNNCGGIPLCIERALAELNKAQTDWRTVLNEFVQEEITDYSFTPPDRRFEDSPFFLPDFNEKEDLVKDILFFIDTSGSMSDKMITQAYSEIKGAIDQFNGRLTGWLGFFDAEIVLPKRFEDENEFEVIRPVGGGGTNFNIIFRYVREHMENPPASIIILTDGYANFPKEKVAMGIPVLWIINNEEITPPWGRVTRITVD